MMTPDLEATLRAALARATDLLPIVVHDGPDYAEATAPHFQAMTVKPDAFEALNILLPGVSTLLDTLTALRAQVEGLRRNADAWVRWYELADSGDDCEYLNGNAWPDAEALASTTMGLLASLKQESSRG